MHDFEKLCVIKYKKQNEPIDIKLQMVYKYVQKPSQNSTYFKIKTCFFNSKYNIIITTLIVFKIIERKLYVSK